MKKGLSFLKEQLHQWLTSPAQKQIPEDRAQYTETKQVSPQNFIRNGTNFQNKDKIRTFQQSKICGYSSYTDYP